MPDADSANKTRQAQLKNDDHLPDHDVADDYDRSLPRVPL